MSDSLVDPAHPARAAQPRGWGRLAQALGRWRRWPQIIGLGRLVRLSNSLPAAAAVLIGARMASGGALATRVWLAAAAMWAITAFGYASNDLWDVAEDRINKPGRPVVAGIITAQCAGRLCVLLAVAALTLAGLLGWRELAIAGMVLVLLTLYSWRLKATPGGGNLLIALLAGNTLLTGAVAARGFTLAALSLVWPAAVLVSTFIAARELLKTLEDVGGDRAAGKRTMAVAYGEQTVVRLLGGLTVLTGVVSLLAVGWGGFSTWFLLFVLVGLLTPLWFTVGYLWPDASPVRATRCLRLLKASYFVGLVALLLA